MIDIRRFEQPHVYQGWHKRRTTRTKKKPNKIINSHKRLPLKSGAQENGTNIW